MEKKYKEFIITDDRSKANPNAVKELLSTSYWAQNRDIETIKKLLKIQFVFQFLKTISKSDLHVLLLTI